MKAFYNTAAALMVVVFCCISLQVSDAGTISSSCSRRIYRAQAKVNRDTKRCTSAEKAVADHNADIAQVQAQLDRTTDASIKRRIERRLSTMQRRGLRKTKNQQTKCSKKTGSINALNSLQASCANSGSSSSSTTTTTSGSGGSTSSTSTTTTSSTTTTAERISCPSGAATACQTVYGGCYDNVRCECGSC